MNFAKLFSTIASKTTNHSEKNLAGNPENKPMRRGRFAKLLAMLPIAGLVGLAPQTAHATISITCDDLVDIYAPTFYFHPDEQYLPVTITEFLEHSTLRSSSGTILASSMDHVNDLQNATTGDSNEYLEVDSTWATTAKDLNGVSVYYNCVEKTDVAEPYFDISYSFLTAYNGCQGMRMKTVNKENSNAKTRNFSMCNLGRHYGDWEHVTVRISSTETKLFTSAHGDTMQWSESQYTTEADGSPQVYVALNTHGTWPSAGYQTLWDMSADTSFTEQVGLGAIILWHDLVTNIWAGHKPQVQNIKIVDIMTTTDLLDTSGGSFKVLSPSNYTLTKIDASHSINVYKGRWGQSTSNSNISGSVGDIPNISDGDFTGAVQDIMDAGGLDDYKTGKGPQAPWTKDYWFDGE